MEQPGNLPRPDHASVSSSQLAALHTFECAARHLSFTQAAAELCMTASAVSHRILKLEQQLGFRLFQRLPRQLQLSDEGRRLFALLSDSLQRVGQEVDDIRRHELSGSLTLFSRPSLAQCWLVPRLADFGQRYPAIRLDLRTGNEDIDFRTQPVDLALYYGTGQPAGRRGIPLMDEEITPVCSPDYARRHDLIEKPELLPHCTLLHDARAWPQAGFDAEWRGWAEQHGITGLDGAAGMIFDRSDLAVTAAIHHTGVAMGRRRLVEQALRQGSLIAPFRPLSSRAPQHYYLVLPERQPPAPRLRVFIQWLMEQAGHTEPWEPAD